MKNISIFLLIISNILLSKEIIINSKIVNCNGEPLHKANILCDNKFESTDKNGDFIIQCNESSIIDITYIGHEKYQITAIHVGSEIILNSVNIFRCCFAKLFRAICVGPAHRYDPTPRQTLSTGSPMGRNFIENY